MKLICIGSYYFLGYEYSLFYHKLVNENYVSLVISKKYKEVQSRRAILNVLPVADHRDMSEPCKDH